MFEFVNERLINSATDAYSGRPKFEKLPKGSGFRIYRYGTFEANHIVNRTVYKTPSSQPIKPSIEITIPGSIIPTQVGEVKNIRLMVEVRRRGSVRSDYSTYNSRVKARPIVANLTITKDDTAKGIAAEFVEILKDQDFLYDNLVINFKLKTDGGTTIVLSGEDEFQYFYNVEVQELVNWNTAALGTYYPVEPVWRTLVKYDTDTKVDGKEGFGTYWTMLKNIQIQNSNRTDIFSQDNDDTRLIPGASYTQYVLDYRHHRDITGMGAVGEELVSITKHIMWVNDDLVEEFDAMLSSADVIVDNIDLEVKSLTVSPETVTVQKGNTAVLTITTNPAGGMYYTESLDEKVATVDDKTITGVEVGETQVVVSGEDGNFKAVDVTVTA